MKRIFFIFLAALVVSACSEFPIHVATPEPCPDCVPQVCPTCVAVTSCPPTVVFSSPTIASPSSTPLLPTFKPTQTATWMPTYTQTLIPSATATMTKFNTPVASITPQPPPWQYQLQINSPTYTQNFAHPEQGCNWSGAAGQIFSNTGVPTLDIVIVVDGRIESKPVNLVTLTGTAKSYGPGGYEVFISDKPFDSTNTFFMTLYDLNGIPLSLPVPLQTQADCKKNLILVNFVQR